MTKRIKDRQCNGQKKDKQYNGQAKKDKQYNEQTKKTNNLMNKRKRQTIQ